MRPRFSLHELFLTTTLIALGVFGISVLVRAPALLEHVHAAAPFIYFGSAIVIGMGVGVPFQQRTTGGVLGFVLSILALPILAVTIAR